MQNVESSPKAKTILDNWEEPPQVLASGSAFRDSPEANPDAVAVPSINPNKKKGVRVRFFSLP